MVTFFSARVTDTATFLGVTLFFQNTPTHEDIARALTQRTAAEPDRSIKNWLGRMRRALGTKDVEVTVTEQAMLVN